MTNIPLNGEYEPNVGYKAAEAMQFTFDYDSVEATPDDALGGPQILDDVLDEQRLKPLDSGWNWNKGAQGSEYYYNTESGTKTHIYNDGSEITVVVTSEIDRENPNPKSKDDLRVLFTMSHTEDPATAKTTTYYVHQGQQMVTCKTDTTFGANIESLGRMFDSAEAAAGTAISEMDEDSFMRLFDGIMDESVDLQDGNNPDDDPMRNITRAEDPIYKVASDAIRDAHAGQKLEAYLGIEGERLVGQEEINKVAELIRSL